MKQKWFAAVLLTASLLLALTACGGTSTPSSDDLASSAVSSESKNGSASSAEVSSTGGGESTSDESWKAAFEESLFNSYGVIPKRYEDLGNGIYQVYAEVGGQVVPFVTVDSATGDYHG